MCPSDFCGIAYLALDRKYINPEEHKKAHDLASEAKKLINGLIGYLRGSKAND